MGARVKPPRVVFDTNVVLSALLFESGRLAWLRAAWQSGAVLPLTSRETVTELLRVLAYPKFQLTAIEREDLLAEYLLPAALVAMPRRRPSLPLCRDPKDRPFLALALAGHAAALVTGDADLLVLGRVGRCPILTPAQFQERTRG